LDDLARDTILPHMRYHIPGKLVASGDYGLRGLVRPQIDLRYEMSVYNHGNRHGTRRTGAANGWPITPAERGALCSRETAPIRPGKPAPGGQIIVGSFVSEGGSGVAWLDCRGTRSTAQLWIGGSGPAPRISRWTKEKIPRLESMPIPAQPGTATS